MSTSGSPEKNFRADIEFIVARDMKKPVTPYIAIAITLIHIISQLSESAISAAIEPMVMPLM